MKKLGALLLFATTSLHAGEWITLHEHTGKCHTLVFSPHPDDDVIGCGGTITKRVAEGKRVAVVYMTSGEGAGSAAVREREARKAARHLGVHKVKFLRFPDGGLSMHRRFLGAVLSAIEELRPSVIYSPHGDDGHSDHQVTYRLVTQALQSMPGYTPIHLKYEVWTPLVQVGHLEDISGFMSQKLAALRMHVSQVSQIAYQDAIEGLNKFRGVMDGAMAGMPCTYAEAFGK